MAPDDEVIVLVPDDIGLRILADCSPLCPIRYELGFPPDDVQRRARVLVVRFPDVEPTLELIHQLPALELMQTLSAGYEQWVGRLPPRVRLANVRGVHGRAVAEWVLAVLLAHYRHLGDFAEAQRTATWRPRPVETLVGKNVTILGAGDIAVRTRELLAPFGGRVRLVGRSRREGVITMADYTASADDDDVVVVAVPVTPLTRGIVDAAFLDRLKPGAVVVNAGRGVLVDTAALAAAAEAGRVRGILDVVEPEPLPDGHPLWSTPGITITPHVAGAIPGVWERAWDAARRNLLAFAAGTEPPDLADAS